MVINAERDVVVALSQLGEEAVRKGAEVDRPVDHGEVDGHELLPAVTDEGDPPDRRRRQQLDAFILGKFVDPLIRGGGWSRRS